MIAPTVHSLPLHCKFSLYICYFYSLHFCSLLDKIKALFSILHCFSNEISTLSLRNTLGTKSHFYVNSVTKSYTHKIPYTKVSLWVYLLKFSILCCITQYTICTFYPYDAIVSLILQLPWVTKTEFLL